MKRLFVTVLFCAAAAGAAFSQSRGGSAAAAGFSLGGRLGGAFNMYAAEGDYKRMAEDLGTSLALNAAVQGTYTFNNIFGIQSELLFTADEAGFAGGPTATLSYTSLLIPILAKFSYRTNKFVLSGLAGPYLTVPLGDGEVKVDLSGGSETGTIKVSSPLGLMFGVNVGVPSGKGFFFGDLRYALDLGPTEGASEGGDKEKVFTRSSVLFSVGYELPVGKGGGARKR